MSTEPFAATTARPHWLTFAECPRCRDLTRPGANEGFLCEECEQRLTVKNGRFHWWTFSECDRCRDSTRNVADDNGVLLCDECQALGPAEVEQLLELRQEKTGTGRQMAIEW